MELTFVLVEKSLEANLLSSCLNLGNLVVSYQIRFLYAKILKKERTFNIDPCVTRIFQNLSQGANNCGLTVLREQFYFKETLHIIFSACILKS